MAEDCGCQVRREYVGGVIIGDDEIVRCPQHAAAPKMKEVLEAIRDYEPREVVKDDFAYDRMVENYRDAARKGLAAAERRDA